MVASRAFSPGHVTGFFSIHPHEDPLHHGSTGAGFSLDLGLVTTLEVAETTSIFLNGQPLVDAPVSEAVLRLYAEATGDDRPWRVDHRTDLPVGCGFGTSGAGALSLALALDAAGGSPLGRIPAAALAHRAELWAGTGLGTVLGEVAGGLEVRTAPGAPGTGQVASLDFADGLQAVFLVYGPLATPRLLGDPHVAAAITRAGLERRGQLLARPSVGAFLELSYDFGRQAGLVSPRLRALQDDLATAGWVCPMLMFGDGLFTLVERPNLEGVLDRFQALAPGARVFASGLDRQGGRVLV